MARTTVVELIDDVSGGAAEETVGFALDKVNYEIDLSRENAERLREDLAGWIGAARRVSVRSKRARSSQPDPDIPRIRRWAREQGMDVAHRGRIAAELREAFYAAQKADTTSESSEEPVEA